MNAIISEFTVWKTQINTSKPCGYDNKRVRFRVRVRVKVSVRVKVRVMVRVRLRVKVRVRVNFKVSIKVRDCPYNYF
jgi:hypothetical protein